MVVNLDLEAYFLRFLASVGASGKLFGVKPLKPATKLLGAWIPVLYWPMCLSCRFDALGNQVFGFFQATLKPK